MTTEHQDAGDRASEDEESQTDPPGDAHAATTLPLHRRKEFWFWVTAFTLAVLVAASLAIPLPYFVEGPGTVRPTEARIQVSGARAFDADGRISFTTVSQTPATPALLLRAWLDDAIDVLPREEALGGRTDKEDRAINQQLMDDSKVVALVVAFREVGMDADFTGDGAMVDDTAEGLPARGVLEHGDVIVAVDGRAIRVAGDLSEALAGRAVGDEVTLSVRSPAGDGVPSGDERTVTLHLGSSTEAPGRALLGVAVTTANLRADLPADVELDSGSVIGPSAGLAWTLGVIDRLTPGRLDGGRDVVVTGTMSIDGTVGPIGGLAQKTRAAIDSGADLMLYPADSDPKDVRRMKDLAAGHLRVEPVATIDDAIEILAPKGLPRAPAAS